MSVLGAGTALFEIRDVAGDTDMLVSDSRFGAALAKALGERSTVLMRGHGSTVVGTSVEQAVYRAIYAEVNRGCKFSQAAGRGHLLLSVQEAAKAANRPT
jgi:HCOMODA/2-hydroxy-3-carboxy-muconic semialdehyde decarboxylase